MPSDAKTAFTAFLSHRYKSPEINEFFFNLFSSIAEVQFEVDMGSTATNVTRLERLVGHADAFIGIYPFDPVDAPQPATQDLLDQSKYFRLELDLASRALKPGVVFRDARYRGVLRAPSSVKDIAFDAQEVMSRGLKPSSAGFERVLREFATQVAAAQTFELLSDRRQKASTDVGILVPNEKCEGGYSANDVETIAGLLEENQYSAVRFDWPPVITPGWMERMQKLGWIVVDTGPVAIATGVVGFLHGEFIPAMRLSRVKTAAEAGVPKTTGLALYDGYEVGYAKDIIRWYDTESLTNGLKQRLGSLDAGRRRISTLEDALAYFRSAALRKEAVFLSYAGADDQETKPLREAFQKKFQKIFDYRDGKSIRTGQPWVREIFDQLAVCPIGIPLLSSAYVGSGNCMHELRQMIARVDDKKMQIFPIKLRADDKFDIPPELQSTQYARTWEYGSTDELIKEKIIAQLTADPAKP